jgi:diguanylate cyclase (GGDEF)-like protein
MPEVKVYDRPLVDGRFEVETLALRWSLVALYAIFVVAGVIEADGAWFAASEGFLVAFHVFYTWRTWYELRYRPLPDVANYATPFLDTLAITLALIAVGEALHPIWGVYFFVIVAVAFYYHAAILPYLVWLIGNYLFVGIGLQLRGLEVPAPAMGVGAVVLLAGMANLAVYTRGERRLRDRVSVAARTDPLTNLLNRRGLQEMLAQQLAAAARDGSRLGVLMIDIDRFKRYNDQFGHLAADAVLEQLGQLLTEAVRAPDLVGRYGGDEFVLVVPGVGSEEALQLAERLRQQVERSGLCTVSVGVSAEDGRQADAEGLLDLADAALLRAKQAGRNRVRGPLPAHAAA